jgi:subtilisin family serine protease
MKIAIIDSGIHAGHPHVGNVAGGVCVTNDGFANDTVDRLGHGTAVAAAIREKVPEAELFAVKVFEARLSAKIDVILRALTWSIEHGMDVVNLSLGTANNAHRARFERALSSGALVVSAAHMIPGSLPGVIGVAAEEGCPRDAYLFRDGVFYASPYPRSIPGVTVDRNLHGASFAVANMTGFVARALMQTNRQAVRAAMIAGALQAGPGTTLRQSP